MQPLLDISNLSKSFGPTRAPNNVDLTLPRQKVHAIVGESGAGKSTLIKVLVGARLRDVGQILLEGIAQRTYTMANKGLHFCMI